MNKGRRLLQDLKLSICILSFQLFFTGCDPIINIMAFHPDSSDVIAVEHLPKSVKEVFLETEDNLKLQSYYLPDKQSDLILIYFHGNAGNIGHRIYDLMKINSLGMNVLGISYRGYGKSEGKPDEAGIYIDGKTAVLYSNKTLGFPMSKIYILGRSIGTTVAVNSAQNIDIGGLILVSPLLNGRAQAKASGLGYVAFLAGDSFNNSDKIENVKSPVLIIHGTADRVIPFSMGEVLFNRVKTQKQFIKIDGANHNDLSTQFYNVYWSSIDTFIKSTIKE